MPAPWTSREPVTMMLPPANNRQLNRLPTLILKNLYYSISCSIRPNMLPIREAYHQVCSREARAHPTYHQNHQPTIHNFNTLLRHHFHLIPHFGATAQKPPSISPRWRPKHRTTSCPFRVQHQPRSLVGRSGHRLGGGANASAAGGFQIKERFGDTKAGPASLLLMQVPDN